MTQHFLVVWLANTSIPVSAAVQAGSGIAICNSFITDIILTLSQYIYGLMSYERKDLFLDPHMFLERIMCICIHCRYELELSDIDCLVEYQNEGGLKAQTYCNSYWLTKESEVSRWTFCCFRQHPKYQERGMFIICLITSL